MYGGLKVRLLLAGHLRGHVGRLHLVRLTHQNLEDLVELTLTRGRHATRHTRTLSLDSATWGSNWAFRDDEKNSMLGRMVPQRLQHLPGLQDPTMGTCEVTSVSVSASG